MRTVEVSRTLVKSPPEVWAELERVERLAELLGDESVTITASRPEALIEWEGNAARGKIEIATSGWGTKVSLSADVDDAEVAPPEPEPEPVAVAAVEPEPEPEALPEPELAAVEEQVAKRGLWARIKDAFTGGEIHSPADPPESGTIPAGESEEVPESVPAPEPVVEVPADSIEDQLTAVLDHLGSAHKRPFSSM